MQDKKKILAIAGIIIFLLISFLVVLSLTRDGEDLVDFENEEERDEEREEIDEDKEREREKSNDDEKRDTDDGDDINKEKREEIEEDNDKEDNLSDTKEKIIESETVTYHGRGEEIVGIQRVGGRMTAFYIKGNSEGKLFSVVGVSDVWGIVLPPLVNTARPYEGVVLDSSGRIDMLEIKAEGDWEVRYFPVDYARKIEVPGRITGEGDDVIQIEGIAKKIHVIGNKEGEHYPKQFNINGYSPERHRLVETTNIYDERLDLPEGIFLLEIRGDGEWEISLE